MGSWQHSDLVLVDTHAHYYPFCTYSEYFATACINMSDWARKLGHSLSFTNILCLLDTKTSHICNELFTIAQTTKTIEQWRIDTVGNNVFLRVSDGLGRKILILPGTQMVSSEKLEVLVIGTTEQIPHDKPALSYIEDFSASKLVILPWGAGKWLGKRGDIVSNIITSASQYKFALGDNSCRPRSWYHVPQFEQAQKKGINILPGSDPLPITGQYKKVGSNGVAIKGPLTASDIFSQLRELMINTEGNNITNYGKSDNLLQFAFGQLLLRTRRL